MADQVQPCTHSVTIGQRHVGYLEALEEAGLAPAERFEKDPVEASGLEIAEMLLAVERERNDADAGAAGADDATGIAGLDALVCGNDELAMAIISRLTAAGVDVPGRLAVTGWDDTVTARYLTPGLTTVRQDVAELGALAAQRLAALIDGDTSQSPVTVDSNVVLRQSCGCAPDPVPALA